MRRQRPAHTQVSASQCAAARRPRLSSVLIYICFTLLLRCRSARQRSGSRRTLRYSMTANHRRPRHAGPNMSSAPWLPPQAQQLPQQYTQLPSAQLGMMDYRALAGIQPGLPTGIHPGLPVDPWAAHQAAQPPPVPSRPQKRPRLTWTPQVRKGPHRTFRRLNTSQPAGI